MPKGVVVTDVLSHWLDGLIIQPSGHWRYGTSVTSEGYGYICYNGTQEYAHRFSYGLYVGPIPEGTEPDHLCQYRWCVCPFHLEAVSHAVNIRRAYRVCGAKLHDMTDPANYYQRKNGGRLCKPCNDRRNAARFNGRV